MTLKDRFFEVYKRPMDRWLVAGIPILLLLIGLQNCGSPRAEPMVVERTQADDFIPAGFVLIPVQLENHQSIDSIVGGHAIVNLYVTRDAEGVAGSRNLLLGRNLRMVRAPLNPQQFAVLVPEKQVDRFVVNQGHLTAVLQNRSAEAGAEMSLTPVQRAIQYY